MKITSGIFLTVLSVTSLFAQDFTEIQIADGIETFSIGDFNNDGKPDLVGNDFRLIGSSFEQILINTSSDQIEFDAFSLLEGSSLVGSPVAGDVDGDGDDDYIYSSNESFDLLLRRNDGSNNFPVEDMGPDVMGISELELVDLEGDGDLDLIGYVFDEKFIRCFINDGVGNFSVGSVIEHQNDISYADYGDLDGDGDVDIALSVDKFSGETVASYLNDSLNNFEKFTAADINALNSAVQVRIVDFNKDGKMDVLGLNDKKLTVFIQSNVFGFVPQDLIEPNNIGDLSKFEIADFDGDEDLDVVIGDLSSDLYWYENTGITFTQRRIGGAQGITDLVAEDFDGDGDIDLIASNGDFYIYTNEVNSMSSSLEIFELENLKIRPNPFTNFITLEGSQENFTELRVYNSIGALVLSKPLTSQNKRLQLADLDSGIYTLHFINTSTAKAGIARVIKH